MMILKATLFKKLTRYLFEGVCVLILFITLLISCNKIKNGKPEELDTSVSVTEDSTYDLAGKNARFYLTAKDTDHRLSDVGSESFSDLAQPVESKPFIMVDPNQRFQTVSGIGGALTDASAETFYKLPESAQQELLKAYFDPNEGLGYTLCRTHIHSCDFSSESYTYTTSENDTALATFNIDHDRKYKLPFIKEAMATAGEGLNILASPWSPPAWMKSNNHMLRGGKLLQEFRQSWANYYVKFIEAYEQEGIPIWGLTVQNEPMARQRWESCIYTAEEERDFVKDYLGPTVKSSDYPDTKIIIWDHNRGLLYQRAKEVYEDPEASQYVWGTGFHWYVGDHFDNLRLHREAFPDKNLLFTEGCVFPFKMDSVGLWKWGERYGESILQDLNNGAVGWIDWNILLDETGGPNHVSNFCYAPIIGDTRTGELIYMNSYYYLGHFSKFIRPGAQRVTCSTNYDDLLATAFLNKDGLLAVVTLNLTSKPMTFNTWVDQKVVEKELPPHAIMTVVID